MRTRKFVLLGGMGFAGGIVGSAAAELLPELPATTAILSVGAVAVRGAVFAAGIALGLIWALEIYSGRKLPGLAKLGSGLLSGVMAGAIASGVAQAVFRLHRFHGAGQFFFQSACWGLTGALLGWRLSRAIPNLGAKRGFCAGLVGGWLGGMGFLLVASVLPEAIGRMVGFGILGAALGLVMVIVEAIFREAALQVIWGPKEVTVLSLGPKPISIGGGSDDVYLSGLTPGAAEVSLEQGRIYCTDTATGKKTEFRDGSQIKVGKVEMVVIAKK